MSESPLRWLGHLRDAASWAIDFKDDLHGICCVTVFAFRVDNLFYVLQGESAAPFAVDSLR